MIVLPNMGLVKWNEVTDYFSHEQLAANFQALDEHNHTAGKGAQIAFGGLAPLSVGPENLREGVFTASKLGNESIETSKIKNLAITTAKIASAAVTEEKMASPSNGVYRTIFQQSGNFGNKNVAGTYILGPKVWPTETGVTETSLPYFYFVNADYTVANKTLKFRLRSQILVNGTKPTVKFTFGLYPIATVKSAGGENLKLGVGSVVTGSAVSINEPAIESLNNAVTSDFAAPSDGYYLLGMATNATMPENSFVDLSSQLQLHWV